MQISQNEVSIVKSDANSMHYETLLYLYDYIVLGNMDLCNSVAVSPAGKSRSRLIGECKVLLFTRHPKPTWN